MTVEKLGDFLDGAYQKHFLNKIYHAQKLETEIRKQFDDEVKVVPRAKIISIVCQSPNQAKFYELRKRNLYAMVSKIFGPAAKGLQIRVKVGR